MDNENNNFECTICLQEINIMDLFVKNFCQCNAKYHKHCINKHFEKVMQCPICKK